MARHDFILDQGASFSLSIEGKYPNNELISLDGMSARSKMKTHYTSSTSHDFECQISNGNIILSMDFETTANIEPGRYVYDVEIYDDETVIRFIEGVITVSPEVTK